MITVLIIVLYWQYMPIQQITGRTIGVLYDMLYTETNLCGELSIYSIGSTHAFILVFSRRCSRSHSPTSAKARKSKPYRQQLLAAEKSMHSLVEDTDYFRTSKK